MRTLIEYTLGRVFQVTPVEAGARIIIEIGAFIGRQSGFLVEGVLALVATAASSPFRVRCSAAQSGVRVMPECSTAKAE